MYEFIVAGLIFLLLVAASVGTLLSHGSMPEHHRQDDTHAVIRLTTNIFVVMTSLVLGLLINSAKNTLDLIDRNLHSFATELVLLDENLRRFGPEASVPRQRLADYVRQAVAGTWTPSGDPVIDDRKAEGLLNEVGDRLLAIKPGDPDKLELWRNTQLAYQNVVRKRWSLVEESEGTIPTPLLCVVVAWMVLIFASFGYRAPRNVVVVVTFVVSALLISGAIYLILDMESPFSGPMQVSPRPLLRVLAHFQR